MLPMTAGSIVLAYNVPGRRDGLKLSREAYAGIFLGKVTKWNDPLIAKANPDVKLPDMTINVVVRADSSGTTFVFTKHLGGDQRGLATDPGVEQDRRIGRSDRSRKGTKAWPPASSRRPARSATSNTAMPNQAKLPMASAGEQVPASSSSPRSLRQQAALASVDMPDEPDGLGPRSSRRPNRIRSSPIPGCIGYKKYADAGQGSKVLKDVIKYSLGRRPEAESESGIRSAPRSRRRKSDGGAGQYQVDSERTGGERVGSTG